MTFSCTHPWHSLCAICVAEVAPQRENAMKMSQFNGFLSVTLVVQEASTHARAMLRVRHSAAVLWPPPCPLPEKKQHSHEGALPTAQPLRRMLRVPWRGAARGAWILACASPAYLYVFAGWRHARQNSAVAPHPDMLPRCHLPRLHDIHHGWGCCSRVQIARQRGRHRQDPCYRLVSVLYHCLRLRV